MYKRKIFKNKYYKHIDEVPNISEVIPKITNNEYIEKHGFYPFIGTRIIYKKYSKDISAITEKHWHPKIRNIKYASHLDSLIYQWYSHLLNEKYNKYCTDNGFSHCSVAYRTCFSGKSSINFAKEFIDAIKKCNECYIIVSDFHQFFDKIDHGILKNNINKVMGFSKMPDDWYKVYKSMTKYCYISKESIEKKLIEEKLETKKSLKSLTCYFQNISWKDAKSYFIEEIKENINKNGYGIPQGSPLSGIFSNVFMIDFDKKMNDYVKIHNGFYMRYCDDIAIVIPTNAVSNIEQIWDEVIKYKSELTGLEINKQKTCCYIFRNNKIESLHSELELFKESPDWVSYLGFTFDGKFVKFRDKTIIKYYYKFYHKIDRMKKHERIRLNKGKHRKSLIDKHMILKELKVTGKSRRFSDYLRRAKKVFYGESYIQNFDKNTKNKLFNRFNNDK